MNSLKKIIYNKKSTYCKTELITHLNADNGIFHVHTARCRHASEETVEEYIETAIRIGSPYIVFTDHAPFPGDPFTNRMLYEELDDYIEEINMLKERYSTIIDIYTGLEIEYLPSFHEYYESLAEKGSIDILLLGQHFIEYENGKYSFSDKEEEKETEYRRLAEGIIEGMKTNLFAAVAHPDRIFRYNSIWTEDMTKISKKVIEIADEKEIYLEKNLSLKKNKLYRNEFWDLCTCNTKIISGTDAHKTSDLPKKL